MRTFLRFSLFILAIIMVLCIVSTAQDKKISKKDVPAVVISSFQKAYPNAKIKQFLTENEGGKIYYEIESLEGKKTIDALLLPDGTIYEVEEGIAAKDLPAPVVSVISGKYPKSTIAKAEKTTHGTDVSYDLQVRNGKTKIGMTVDPTGKILKESKGSAKKEKEEERD
jgi:hypothetical protein